MKKGMTKRKPAGQAALLAASLALLWTTAACGGEPAGRTEPVTGLPVAAGGDLNEAEAGNLEVNLEPASLNLIASEKVEPADFNEAALRREEAPGSAYLVTKSEGSAEFRKQWAYYRFAGALPAPEAQEQTLLFIGVRESGSCPYELINPEWNPDRKELSVTLATAVSEDEHAGCTTDSTPRTFVAAADQALADSLESFIIIENKVKTLVPVQ